MSQFGKFLFSIRSYTPIPLIILAIIFAQPSRLSLSLGGFITTLGELIRLWAVGYAGSITRASDIGAGMSLVTSGPYAHVRNPIYLGNFLISLGVCIAASVLWIIPIFILGYITQYYSIIEAEEEHLKKRFAALYENYLANVPKIIPKIKAYKAYKAYESYEELSEHKFSIQRALKSERRTFVAIGLTFGIIAYN